MDIKQYLNQFSFVEEVKMINNRCAVYQTKTGPIFAVFQTKRITKYIIKHTSRLIKFHCSFDLRSSKPKDSDLILFKSNLVKCFKKPERIYDKIITAAKEIQNG